MAVGQIRKMRTELGDPVRYELHLNEQVIVMSDLIGKEVGLRFGGEIVCVSCGKPTKKSFGQGFCFPCFQSAPEAAECIIRPELCRAHLGEGRDPEWEKANHAQDHYVYLALSSAVKVGITRSVQVPTRWIDQGASAAVKLALTPNRYIAGLIEVALKDHFTDKTNWRKMLKNEVADIDLVDAKDDAADQLPEELQEFVSDDDEVTSIIYPVDRYPEKVTSLNLDKDPEVRGTLAGIKGQYLLFDNDTVINIRKYTGYVVEVDV